MDMSIFFKAIPAAATSEYALVAYVVAAIVFLFAGFKLSTISKGLKALPLIPEPLRPAALETILGEKMPDRMTAPQWIRYHRIKWGFLLAVSVVLAILTVAIVALNLTKNPTIHQVEKLIKKQSAESDRRNRYPLEDAELYAEIILDPTIKGLSEYLSWVNAQFKQSLVGDCYDTNTNPLKIELLIPRGVSQGELVCSSDFPISIPVNSPLFPTYDHNGAEARETLVRLRADIEFFGATPQVEEYGVDEHDGRLVMKFDSNEESENDVPRSIRAVVNLGQKQLRIRANGFKFRKESWRRIDPHVSSLVDLVGMQMVFWVQPGEKKFSSNDLNLARSSASLGSFYLRLGGLRIAPDPKQWRPIKDRFGNPAWVYVMPPTPEGVLAMLK